MKDLILSLSPGPWKEYELIDTGIFDKNEYFDVFVEYAKNSPNDILIKMTVHNRSSEAAELHLLPNLWFRNTWSWGLDVRRPRPQWPRHRAARTCAPRLT